MFFLVGKNLSIVGTSVHSIYWASEKFFTSTALKYMYQENETF